jgi:RNA polymerase sigma factor (sigma-70 family)
MRKTSPTVLRYLGALYREGALSGYSDGQLLERVTAPNDTNRTDAELAFATLLARHGQMVWRVCRSLVLDDHEAEDAFQATFLVLIRKAGTLRIRETLGPWLYAVANRIGMSARAASLRRRTIERTAAKSALNDSDSRIPERSGEIEEMGVLIHQEVMRLPERFHTAVLLCDIEGVSYHQAASHLQVPLGTLQSRLARARKRLRTRLIKRGIGAFDPAEGPDSTTILIATRAARLVPSLSLEHTTCCHCVSLAAEPAGPKEIVSRSVQVLIKKGSTSMSFSRWSGVALIPIAAMALSDAVFFDNQTKAQPRQNRNVPPKGAFVSQPDSPALTKSGSLIIPAIREARAAAGRAKALVYALDAKGRRIPGEVVPAKRRRRRLEPAEQNGDGRPSGPPAPERADKEVIFDISWAAVTGVIDQRVIEQRLANGVRAGRLWAEQVYRRVELERQERSSTDGWSDWRAVDPEPTIKFLDNLPEVSEERVPEELRITNLMDPLPVLKPGEWKGVDVDRFVPAVHVENVVRPIGKAVRRVPEPPLPPLLMMRQFDFSVQPGHTYRYRARLVVDDSRWRRTEVASAWTEPTESVTVP